MKQSIVVALAGLLALQLAITLVAARDNHTAIAILQKDSAGGRFAGDMYIGNTHGVYLKHVQSFQIDRIPGIFDPIKSIDLDFNGGAFVITSFGRMYYINSDGQQTQGVQNYIQERIITIGVLQQRGTGSRLAGDAYIGTTQGVYLKYVGTHTIKKMVNILEQVNAIWVHENGGAYVLGESGRLYWIDQNGDRHWAITDIPDRVYTMTILDKVINGNRQKNDVYLSTSTGVYLRPVGTSNLFRIPGITGQVASFKVDFNGGVYIVMSSGQLYYLDPNGNNAGEQTYMPSRVLTVALLQKNSSGTRKAGDAYIGTTNGVYLKNVYTSNIVRIKGINGPIHAIDIDHNGAVYVTSTLGFCYYIDVNGNPAGFQADLNKIYYLQ